MLKEPEIKLFGRKIYLPDNGAAAAGGESSGDSSNESSSGSVDCDRCSELCRDEIREGVGERGDGDGGGDGDVEEKLEQGDEDQEAGELCETTPENLDKSQNADASSDSDENSKTPSNENDDQPKLENEQNGQQKTLKKPDKLLPCPRCNSMDTKFCYYNNYNVNQPRHFCKSCQRYWTAGGTMRNVPVGAGRRKNKNLTPNCRHITISEALQSERIIAPNGFQGLKFRPNGTVLSFGPDSKLCEPMESARSLTEKRVPNGVRNDDSVMQNGNGYPSPVPIPGVQWPFPWNSAVPFPPICPPGYPFPYYPAPVWGNTWNVPWLSLPSPTADQKRNISSPTSPLGKHSRKGDLLNPNRSQESSIVVPKTLRIDDPDEAAKSSIWSTLGIKYDSISREGLFKALQSKAADNKSVLNNSPLLQANPAAFSRSMSFQERA